MMRQTVVDDDKRNAFFAKMRSRKARTGAGAGALLVPPLCLVCLLVQVNLAPKCRDEELSWTMEFQEMGGGNTTRQRRSHPPLAWSRMCAREEEGGALCVIQSRRGLDMLQEKLGRRGGAGRRVRRRRLVATFRRPLCCPVVRDGDG